MRFRQIIEGLSDTTNPESAGWMGLNSIKQSGMDRGAKLAKTFQLFVPRSHSSLLTVRDRRLANLAKDWAYDNQGNILPQYEKWENKLDEGAPILIPGKSTSKIGYNKPTATLWTSTARKTADGWTSEWVRYIKESRRNWFSNKGYLYRVKPGACVLKLSDQWDAVEIYHAFKDLGRVKSIPDDLSALYSDQESQLRLYFPWDQIEKHFDAVWHSGNSTEGFMSGWDVESTAWIDASFLELVDEVKIDPYD